MGCGPFSFAIVSAMLRSCVAWGNASMSATRKFSLLIIVVGVILTAGCYVMVERSLTHLPAMGTISEAPYTQEVLDCVLTNLESCRAALKASPPWSDGPYDPGVAWIGIILVLAGLCGLIMGPRRIPPTLGLDWLWPFH